MLAWEVNRVNGDDRKQEIRNKFKESLQRKDGPNLGFSCVDKVILSMFQNWPTIKDLGGGPEKIDKKKFKRLKKPLLLKK